MECAKISTFSYFIFDTVSSVPFDSWISLSLEKKTQVYRLLLLTCALSLLIWQIVRLIGRMIKAKNFNIKPKV